MDPIGPDPALPASLLAALARMTFAVTGRAEDTSEPIGLFVTADRPDVGHVLVVVAGREPGTVVWGLRPMGEAGRCVPCLVSEDAARALLAGRHARVRLEHDGARPLARLASR